MLQRVMRWLLGACATCQERQARLEAQERRITELSDRLMSRDFSHYAFVKAQTEAKPEAREDDPPLAAGLVLPERFEILDDGMTPA